MHSQFEIFFMIDEQSGLLWKIPISSLKVQISEPIFIAQDRFNERFAHSNKDSNAFLTAEIVEDLAGSKAIGLPTHVFNSHVRGHVVYTKAITVESKLNKLQNATQFHLAVSFEEHFRIHYSEADYSVQSIIDLGKIATQELDSNSNGYSQRPPPSSIKDAKLVVDLSTELDAMQRELYATVCCAPYVFRDCFSNISVYWNSTQKHKEHHPLRIALKNRRRREEEQRQIDNVQTLLKRSTDPKMAKVLINNANSGIRVLSDLLQTNNRPKLSKSRQFTNFFGDEGLPIELQKYIVENFIDSILSKCDSKLSWASFKSVLLVSKQFYTIATTATNSKVSAARAQIIEFVHHGVVKSKINFTYNELSCSPSMLLWENTDCFWQLYFQSLLSCKLLSSVCRQRASVNTRVVMPVSKRLLSLQRIVDIS